MLYSSTHTFKIDLKNPGVLAIPGLNAFFLSSCSQNDIDALNSKATQLENKQISLTALPPILTNGHKIELQNVHSITAIWSITETVILCVHVAHKCLNLTVIFYYLLDGHGADYGGNKTGRTEG